MDMYILHGHKVVLVQNVAQWVFEKRVAKNYIGNAMISTVFLGFNLSYRSPGQFFETMIFGGCFDELQIRYATWDEAMAGHRKIIRMVRLKKIFSPKFSRCSNDEIPIDSTISGT